MALTGDSVDQGGTLTGLKYWNNTGNGAWDISGTGTKAGEQVMGQRPGQELTGSTTSIKRYTYTIMRLRDRLLMHISSLQMKI